MKARLTDQDYCRAATRLGCDPAAVAAVAEQESLQAGFDDRDRPTILFERHIFHKLTGGIYDRTNPNISNATPGGYGASALQYARFSVAFALDSSAAMKSASWGKFQILGRNYAVCGFTSVDAFVEAMKVSEAAQLDSFVAFVLHEHLDEALTSHDWTAFADGYNGSQQRKHHYDSLIAAKFAKWQHHDFKCSTTISAAAPAQATDAQVVASSDLTAEVPEQPPTSQVPPPAPEGSEIGSASYGGWIQGTAGKFDRVNDAVTGITSRGDAVKALWASVTHITIQPVWAIFAWVLHMPWWMYVGVAAFVALTYVLYHHRQLVMGKIRETFGMGAAPAEPANVTATATVKTDGV